MYRTLVFDSTWGNECVFSEQGDPMAPGARPLAEAIASGISSRGVAVGPVEQHSYHGWGFQVWFQRCGFFVILNPVKECYLTISLQRRLLLWLTGRRPGFAFRAFGSLVESVLRTLDGVSGVRWDAA